MPRMVAMNPTPTRANPGHEPGKHRETDHQQQKDVDPVQSVFPVKQAVGFLVFFAGLLR